MAVLKDLIVHGRSRFVNGIDADSIHANLIDANDGVFKTITTTTLDAETITTEMLNATNARVAQTLTVEGTISTNKWEAANIANIGGNFYISPTGKADSGTITVTKTGSVTINGVSVGVYTLVVGNASFGVTTTNGTVWGPTSGNQSKVIFTGSISYNNSKKYPLGTCNGTMTAFSPGTNTLTGFTITGVSSPALDIFFQEVGVSSVSSTACNGYEMQISVYQTYSNSALRPVGILLTSYGKEKKQYIDIYNGENALGDSASGFATPGVRIGLLDGLPDIRDGVTASDSPTKPSGWGIYTQNGFFKGKIVSNAGIIANFTINNGKLYSNNHSAYNTAVSGIYIGDDYISFGSGGVTYFNTSGTGKIGPWTLSTTYLRNGNIASATNTSVAGVYLGTDGLNISNGTAATTSYITKTAVNIGNKLTWNGTTLTIDGSASIGGTTASTVVNNAADGAAAKTGLDNLQIGGRNLFRYTSLTDVISNKWIKNGTAACSINGDKLTITGAGEVYPTSAYYTPYVIPTNTTITLSCYFYENTVSDGNRYIYYAVTPGWRNKRVPANYVGLWSETFTTTEELTVLCPEYDLRNSTGGQWVVSPLKLEIGNKATAWSPAPEDLDVHKYVTDIDTNKGITIKPIDTTGNDYLQINSTSIDFYRGIGTNSAAVSVMSLSDSVFRMGKSDAQRVEITASAVDMYDKNNKLTTRANENGLTIYKAGTQVASYGTDATIGQVAANLYNVFIDADSGIALRKNTTSLLTINSSQIDINNSSGNVITRVNGSGLTIYNGSGTAATNQLAFFGSTATIGASNATHTTIDSAGMRIYAADGTTLIAHLGYGEGAAQTSGTTATAPYCIFGLKETNTSNGNYSVGEGYHFNASGWASHAEGYYTQATGSSSHAEGDNTIARGSDSHAEGYQAIASGEASHAEGYHTQASGDYSHAEGYYTNASNESCHAEGASTTASNVTSHAEGKNTTASGYSSHAEGYGAIAGGNYSHAEGYYTKTTQPTAHAEGGWTIADGSYSHTNGKYTVATEEAQTVIGKYNTATRSGSGTEASPYTYTGVGDYAFIIGNGSGDATANRSNAFMVDWSGDIYPQATKMVDFIVDQGTSGIWTYRKWNSGISECWGMYTWNITTWSTWSGWYYANASAAVAYPSSLFVAVPTLTTNGNISTNDAVLYCKAATNGAVNTPTFSFFRPAAGAANTIGQLSFYAAGRWK